MCLRDVYKKIRYVRSKVIVVYARSRAFLSEAGW